MDINQEKAQLIRELAGLKLSIKDLQKKLRRLGVYMHADLSVSSTRLSRLDAMLNALGEIEDTLSGAFDAFTNRKEA